MKNWEVEISLVNEFGRVEESRVLQYTDKTSTEVTQAVKENISASASSGQRYQVIVTGTDDDWFSFIMKIE